ncbi:hypothetical protein A2U01_0081277, partial [Trifolium medium]|nr:hypothetical protein [Trifolium medium]
MHVYASQSDARSSCYGLYGEQAEPAKFCRMN